MSVLIYLQCCSGIHISSSYRHHRRLTPLRWPLLNRTLLHSDTTLHFNHGETLSDLNANVVSCNLSMLTLLVKPCSVSCVLPYLPLLWKMCLQELSLDWGFTTGLASGLFFVYLISWGLWVCVCTSMSAGLRMCHKCCFFSQILTRATKTVCSTQQMAPFSQCVCQWFFPFE